MFQSTPPIEENSWRHRRLRSELKTLKTDPPEGIQATPLDRQCCHWQASITGPQGSPYEGGLFFLYLQIPHRYVTPLHTKGFGNNSIYIKLLLPSEMEEVRSEVKLFYFFCHGAAFPVKRTSIVWQQNARAFDYFNNLVLDFRIVL